MALIPGWLADLLGFRAAVDSSNVEYPQRRLLRFLGATVVDNEALGMTDVTVGFTAFRWVCQEAPAVNADRFLPVSDGVITAQATESIGQFIVSAPFKATYFSFMCGDEQLNTNTMLCVVRKNGVDTTINFTIPAGTAPGTIISDSAHSVTFARGDRVSVRVHQSGTAVQESWRGLFQLG